MHRYLIILAMAACASGSRPAKSCDPLPAAYQSHEGLYRDCEVDQRARVISTPRPDFSRLEPLVTNDAGCYQAQFTLVVDEKGYASPGTVRLLRTNSETYANAISDQIGGLRFRPAKKSGVPVRQLYVYKSEMAYMVSAGSRSAARRPPPC